MNCKICEEKFDTIYRIPRNLVCGHTFCEQCLKIYTKLDEINCPKCMKSSSTVSLPICYALYEMLELDLNNKKFDFCEIHSFEKNQFYCQEENTTICQICYIKDHKEHKVNSVKEISFVEETKKEFEKNFFSLKEKCDYLYLIKNEIEKCEEFIEKMNEKQIKKLNNIQDSLKSNKKEKIENYEKLIEINYQSQKDNLNKYLKEIEYKEEYVDIYSNQIKDILLNSSKIINYEIKFLIICLEDKSKSEIASFNITKSEDEFKRMRNEFDNIVNIY